MPEIGQFQPASKGRIVIVTVSGNEGTIDLAGIVTKVHNAQGTLINVVAFNEDVPYPSPATRSITSVYHRDHPAASQTYHWHYPDHVPSIRIADAGLVL